MNVDLVIEDRGWDAVPDLESNVLRAATAALDGHRGGVTLLFSNDAEVRALNKEWRGQDKATNVLSFPALQDMPLPDSEIMPLGDIILSCETVTREAAEQGKTVAAHTTHLVVHGILHLLGHDHADDSDAEAMENRERDILRGLGIADPYGP